MRCRRAEADNNHNNNNNNNHDRIKKQRSQKKKENSATSRKNPSGGIRNADHGRRATQKFHYNFNDAIKANEKRPPNSIKPSKTQ